MRPQATRFLLLLFALLALAGCGGSGGAPATDEAPAVNETPGEAPADADSVEKLLYSGAYAGYLVVHFDEALAVRQDQTKAIVSLAGAEDRLAPIRNVIALVPTAEVVRSVAAPEAKVEEQREDLERLSGQQLIDWNSIYHVTAPDPDDALKLMRELKNQRGIVKVYPGMKGTVTGILTTPDLNGYQTYQLAEATYGGLNAAAGWARGATGQDIYVADQEPGTSYSHEDLGLTGDYLSTAGGNFLYPPLCAPGFPYQYAECPGSIAHGTAVAGILVARDNGHGVKGFAPDAHYVHATMWSGAAGDLQQATDNLDDPATTNDDNVEPGSVWVIEVQLPGKFSSGDCGSTPETAEGCVPTELWPDAFAEIQQATAYGVTVVSGAGNGTTDLDNPELYTGAWDFAHNLATEDAGAIMVGASQGAGEQKASYSNCGTRVNAFAWGQGVVTTTYPADANWGWQGTPPSGVNTSSDNPNNWYMNNFGGTSSAAAMVGGAVTQIQSYARAKLGHRRFIMPPKMREIVVNSGVAQVGGGCNIGRQPRVDAALDAVDAFLASARSSYPELDAGTQLTEARYLSMRTMGVGIICKKWDAAGSDPICPDSEIFPEGTGIGRDLDFDADGRADLVAWTNGTWKLDLSSRGAGGDNYGAWDIEIAHAPVAGRWVWPYVIDMNADGRTDFVVYDKEHGTFYVAFTDTALLRDGTWHNWDWIIDYSAEWKDSLKLNPLACTTGTGPNCSNYSRPALGDYNEDDWTDIAIACSDGYWRIDYGGPDKTDFGTFDRSIRYLSDEELSLAPGWAYLAAPNERGPPGPRIQFLSFKVPDGLPAEGRLRLYHPDYTDPANDLLSDNAAIFGGNDAIPLMGFYDYNGSTEIQDIGLLSPDGRWRQTTFHEELIDVQPLDIYGGAGCRPVVANFDTDGADDRAVMCGNEWRLAYSGTDTFSEQRVADGSRRVALGYDPSTFTLPGRPHAGGVSYAWVKQFIESYQDLHPATPPPIPVDMATAQ